MNSHFLSAFFSKSIASLWSILTKEESSNLFNFSIRPFEINLLQNSISSGHLSRTAFTTYFKKSSSMFISSSKSQKEISGSIIQNSFICVLVFEFSERRVGPKVYILLNADA